MDGAADVRARRGPPPRCLTGEMPSPPTATISTGRPEAARGTKRSPRSTGRYAVIAKATDSDPSDARHRGEAQRVAVALPAARRMGKQRALALHAPGGRFHLARPTESSTRIGCATGRWAHGRPLTRWGRRMAPRKRRFVPLDESYSRAALSPAWRCYCARRPSDAHADSVSPTRPDAPATPQSRVPMGTLVGEPRFHEARIFIDGHARSELRARASGCARASATTVLSEGRGGGGGMGEESARGRSPSARQRSRRITVDFATADFAERRRRSVRLMKRAEDPGRDSTRRRAPLGHVPPCRATDRSNSCARTTAIACCLGVL